MKNIALVILIILVAGGLAFSLSLQKKTAELKSTPMPTPNMSGTKSLADFTVINATQASIVTNKGNIVIKLFRDEAPLTTANFLDLASKKFYDGIIFHRVIPDFMAQVGDPLTKDPSQEARWGSGGPGYQIADEFSDQLKHDQAGMVSMANAGPNTGGSQFFITFAPTPWLDGKHAIFGQVTSGMQVLNSFAQGDQIITISYE